MSGPQDVPIFASRYVPFPLDPAWERLRHQVAAGTVAGECLPEYTAIRPNLEQLGIPPALVEGIDKALRGDTWDEAAEAFCHSRGLAFNFYLGPMRAMERYRSRLGLLLLAETSGAPAIVRRIEELAPELGARTFGFACDFHGRRLEFYDLACCAGPFVEAGGRFIALFVPSYLDGCSDISQYLPLRRTILLHNVIRARFEAQTRNAAQERLRIDEAEPSFVRATCDELDQAFVLWYTLHELLHGSGPIPLFGVGVRKLPLGLAYAGVEEMRVDMTAWLMLETCGELFPSDARLAAEVILAERLLRSARFGLSEEAEGGFLGRSSEAENGAFWFASLLECGALQPSSDGLLRIDLQQARIGIRLLLDEVYENESAASSDIATGAEHLESFAAALRQRFFGGASRELQYPVQARQFLAHLERLPTGIAMTFHGDR